MTALVEMLAELESSPLATVLAPSKRAINPWDQIRVNVSVPPLWYRNLCSQYRSHRGVRRGKFDTKIKRAAIIRVLTRLANGKRTWSMYAPELLKIAKSHAARRTL